MAHLDDMAVLGHGMKSGDEPPGMVATMRMTSQDAWLALQAFKRAYSDIMLEEDGWDPWMMTSAKMTINKLEHMVFGMSQKTTMMVKDIPEEGHPDAPFPVEDEMPYPGLPEGTIDEAIYNSPGCESEELARRERETRRGPGPDFCTAGLYPHQLEEVERSQALAEHYPY